MTALGSLYTPITIAGWSSQVARRAHNPKVEGSNPSPATKKSSRSPAFGFTEGDSVAVIQPLGWVVASRICLGSVHETL